MNAFKLPEFEDVELMIEKAREELADLPIYETSELSEAYEPNSLVLIEE